MSGGAPVDSTWKKTKRDGKVTLGDSGLRLIASGGTKRAAPASGLTGATEAQEPAKKKARTLTPTAHDDLPRSAIVHMRPQVELDSTNTVSGVVISSLQRTPSPYGRFMGDHTVSWQSNVDSVRAQLHGQTIPEAITTLRQMQAGVGAWMADPDSFGMQLFNQLDQHDADRRSAPMEDAAYRVEQLCTQAEETYAGDPKGAAGPLAQAIAQHLAYTNYLPFATVPAASERGSTGSGEGTYRGALLDFESARMTAEKGMTPEEKEAERTKLAEDHPDARLLDNALWKMFAFDAALRESRIEYALNPQLLETVTTDYDNMTRVGYSMIEMTEQRPANVDQDSVQSCIAEASEIALRPGQIRDIGLAAGRIRDAASEFQTLLLKAHTDGGKKKIAALSESIMAELGSAGEVVDEIKEIDRQAPRRAAEVLAYLLHKHQRTMAPSYTNSVVASNFLLLPNTTSGTADVSEAAQAAISRLEQAVRQEYPALFKKRAKPAKLDDVLKTLHEKYLTLPPIPVPTDNDWVEHAKSTELVVTYNHGKKPAFTVNGRAPAPSGITGMGCHTTAWAIEQQHPDALVLGAKSDKDALAKLQEAVSTDVTSSVMKLDAMLPFDQIEAGQISAVYDAALRVLEAEDTDTAATAYLMFRNLLPYATVNTGDRGGHAEKLDGDLATTFDKKALRAAAELKQAELDQAMLKEIKLRQVKQMKDDGRDAEAERLREEADNVQLDSERLRVAADGLRFDSERVREAVDALPRGKRKPFADLKKAIDNSADRLTNMADQVVGGTARSVDKTIVDVREAEHESVWLEVQEFRKNLPRTTV